MEQQSNMVKSVCYNENVQEGEGPPVLLFNKTKKTGKGINVKETRFIICVPGFENITCVNEDFFAIIK